MADYNFFADYQRKKGIQIDIRSPYFWGLILILICVLLSVALIARNMFLASRIQNITERTEALKATETYQTASELQDSIDAMNQYDSIAESVLGEFSTAQFLDSDIIYGIVSGIPQNATLVTFAVEDDEMGLTCDVPNRKIASELLLGLKETGLFDSLQMYSVEENSSGGFRVSIDGVLKAGDEE